MTSTVTSGEYPFLPAFAESAGFDLAKVTRIQVDNKVRDRLLPEGKIPFTPQPVLAAIGAAS